MFVALKTWILPLVSGITFPSPQRWTKLAPEFTLLDVTSNTVTKLEDYAYDSEKVLLTCLPGVWSPWSRKVLTSLTQHQQQLEYSGKSIIAIISQSIEPVRDYVKKNEIGYPVLADPYGIVSKRYGVFDELQNEPMQISRPSYFVINSKREVLTKHIGRHADHHPDFSELVLA